MLKFDKALHKDGFWFRLNGYGLNVINRLKNPAPFSVRNGYRKELKVFNYGVVILTPCTKEIKNNLEK